MMDLENSLEFILKLDSKLNADEKNRLRPDNTLVRKYDLFIDKTMTRVEMKRLFQILEENENYFIFLKDPTDNFSEYFFVRDLNLQEEKPILTFKKSQLPQGYDIKKVMDAYFSDSNISKARDAGVNISRPDDTQYTQNEFN